MIDGYKFINKIIGCDVKLVVMGSEARFVLTTILTAIRFYLFEFMKPL